MKILVLIWMGMTGAILGSFACCQAWRLHEKSEGRKMGRWSECMKCRKQLKWYDNIPVISWLVLGGKCRKCHEKIGWAEISMEVMGVLVFVGLGWKMWGEMGGEFVGMIALKYVALAALIVCLGVLAVYDAKWGELPTAILWLANGLAVIYVLVKVLGGGQFDILGVLGGVGILAGVYYLLYFFSKERLVGGGDWILCMAIAIALADWRLAFAELFLANLLALMISAPMAILKKQKQVPFGPFLVVGFVIIILTDFLVYF